MRRKGTVKLHIKKHIRWGRLLHLIKEWHKMSFRISNFCFIEIPWMNCIKKLNILYTENKTFWLSLWTVWTSKVFYFDCGNLLVTHNPRHQNGYSIHTQFLDTFEKVLLPRSTVQLAWRHSIHSITQKAHILVISLTVKWIFVNTRKSNFSPSIIIISSLIIDNWFHNTFANPSVSTFL